VPGYPGALRVVYNGVVRTAVGTERPVTELAPGLVTLQVVFTAALGQKLDDSFGPPIQVEVSASPPGLLVEGAGVGSDLCRSLRLGPGDGVLQVTARAATCDVDAPNGACHMTRQDWGIPVRVRDGGATRLPLVLRGLDPGE
jgi:hypothetical protein